MPCWYFERKEIKYSPSYNDGIDTVTENRYRREGARFIIDAGTKMGLRYDTCSTGVVYFHRFYMFHSFKDFYRYVTAACCLLLAGKVEETPKKCKDIIRIAQSLLSPSSFARFGEDPREEVMTMERVLLKTIKFDFQVEHPYSFMLKYAKLFKGDKEKTQKMAQMAWTFINDSLCTTLCLQWEPEIISVSLMYLASRLTKHDPADWSGRTSSKSKWWEDIIEGLSMELMEDVCHQVLDLYSTTKKQVGVDSPPQSPAKGKKQASPPPPPPPDKTPVKRTRESTPSESERPSKSSKSEPEASHITTIQSKPTGAPIPVAQHIPSSVAPAGYSSADTDINNSSSSSSSRRPADYAAYNPYVSSQMFSSSFMSLEASQNILSILVGNSSGPSARPPSTVAPPSASYADPHHNPPPTDMSQYPPPHHPDPNYGYPTPPAPAPSHVDQSSYNYPPPPPSQYGAPPPTSAPAASLPPPPSHYPPPPTAASAPPPGYDPYNAGSYHGPPPSFPPSTQPIQHPYPPPVIPPAQSYGAPYYPPATVAHHPMTGPPPPIQGMSHPPPPKVSTYPPPTYPAAGGSQPPPGHSRPQGYSSGGGGGGGGGGQSRQRGNFPKQKGNQRKDIPALTDIKISGRPEWGHPN